MYEPNWGLTPPPIETPEFPPLPVPVYVPEWNLMESLDTELAAIKQGMIVFAGEFSRQWDNIAPSQMCIRDRSGTLKNTRYIGYDCVEYRMPYAHYQYRELCIRDRCGVAGVSARQKAPRCGQPRQQ